MPNYNGVWSLTTQYQYAADWPRFVQSRALVMGSSVGAGGVTDTDFFNIETTGNAADFGNLSTGAYSVSAISSTQEH